jgi:hypothetical protein
MQLKIQDDKNMIRKKKTEYIVGLFKSFAKKHNLYLQEKDIDVYHEISLLKDTGKIQKRWFRKSKMIFIKILYVDFTNYLASSPYEVFDDLSVSCYCSEYEDLFIKDFANLDIRIDFNRISYEKRDICLNNKEYRITKC